MKASKKNLVLIHSNAFSMVAKLWQILFYEQNTVNVSTQMIRILFIIKYNYLILPTSSYGFGLLSCCQM